MPMQMPTPPPPPPPSPAPIPFARATMLWLFLAPLLLGCVSRSTPAARADAVDDFATPPFYHIRGEGGASLLLMGTVHLGPPEGWRFSPRLLDALTSANRLVLEIDPREATEDAVGTLLAKLAVTRPGVTLTDLVSPETAKLLDENEATLESLGMPRNASRWKKPWYVALWLLETAVVESDFTPAASADSLIFETLGGRQLIGLESFDEQLAIFDSLSPRLQDVMLRGALLGLDTAVEEIHSLVDAWRHGDERLLEKITSKGIKELPEFEELHDAMLRDRNHRWLGEFRSLLDDREYLDETIFVGVGALHLVGDDGLVRLLRAAGYTVEPIDPQAGKR